MTLLGRLDAVRPWRVFDRPVFVIAAPRSGSTFLFDMLEAHPDLVSWPFEALGAYRRAQPADHPWELGDRWPPEYASESLRRALSRELYLGRLAARHRNALPVSRWERLALRKVRLLEKSPPSVTRLGALARLYPDAVFVHLHRDAPASIGSLIEAWETPSAAHVTGEVAGRTISWMMLTAPGWLDLLDAPIPVRAAFQWRAGIEYVLADLPLVAPRPVLNIAYEQLVADPTGTLLAVLDHCDLSRDPQVLARAADAGKRGRTSLSAPDKDKWRSRRAEIEPLLPDLAALRRSLGYEA